MSLVIGVISEHFAVMCGEGKATYSDNVTLSDFRKVFKFGKDILVGVTGNISGVNSFIGFLFNFDGRRFVKKDELEFCYLDLKNELDRRYDEIINTAKCENFHVSIIGWVDNQFCIDSYFYNPISTSKNRREHTVVDSINNFKFVSMECTGDKHFTDFLTIAKEINASNILLVKNAFKGTLERGVKYDDTINCNAMFESIRRVDISR